MYTILTEDINRVTIIKIVSKQFDSFTLVPAIGYWHGKPEKSLKIEIIPPPDLQHSEIYVRVVAEQIREANKQEAVMVVKSNDIYVSF